MSGESKRGISRNEERNRKKLETADCESDLQVRYAYHILSRRKATLLLTTDFMCFILSSTHGKIYETHA